MVWHSAALPPSVLTGHATARCATWTRSTACLRANRRLYVLSRQSPGGKGRTIHKGSRLLSDDQSCSSDRNASSRDRKHIQTHATACRTANALREQIRGSNGNIVGRSLLKRALLTRRRICSHVVVMWTSIRFEPRWWHRLMNIVGQATAVMLGFLMINCWTHAPPTGN